MNKLEKLLGVAPSKVDDTLMVIALTVVGIVPLAVLTLFRYL